MTSTVPDITDLQAGTPATRIALDEVGVTGIVRGVVVGAEALATTARIDVATSLGGDVRGAHMSRFHEAIDHALMLVADGGRDVPSLEVLAAVIATRAADLQEASGARARVLATLAAPATTPSSGRLSIEPFDAWAEVVVDKTGSTSPRTHVTLGVTAVGMTACPCAQALVRESTRTQLVDAGVLDAAVVDEVLDALPVATHNQRSTGTLEITVPGDGAVTALADPAAIADVVRASMSTRFHELLKRDDELAVVEQAHANPRFVEDCVRALLADAVAADVWHEALTPHTVLRARQCNHESIHAHDVVASRSATVAQLRDELSL